MRLTQVNGSSKSQFISAALTAGLTGLSGIVGVTAAVAQVPAAPARHPRIDRTINLLERTEADRRKADRDFDGHRAKAADLMHQAIEELKLARQGDRK